MAVQFDTYPERIPVPHRPFIHTADDFELTVDEHGTPHFVDMRYLSSFGCRHGGNKAAFCLVLGTQSLVLVITIALGSIANHLALSSSMLAGCLLLPLGIGLVTIFLVVMLYYRWRVAAIILAGGSVAVAIIIGGAMTIGGAMLP